MGRGGRAWGEHISGVKRKAFKHRLAGKSGNPRGLQAIDGNTVSQELDPLSLKNMARDGDFRSRREAASHGPVRLEADGEFPALRRGLGLGEPAQGDGHRAEYPLGGNAAPGYR